jgi:hypothetical protein
MIQIEILESPDKNVLTSFKYFQNMIYIGRSQGDLWIIDSELQTTHVMLEVVGEDLLIHPQRTVSHYLLNGKRATNVRKLKVDDAITIGRTKLRVVSYSETIVLKKKDILSQRLEAFIQANDPRVSLIEKLTKKTN